MKRAFACALFAFVAACSADPSVSVNNEILQGERLAGGIAAFRGIPFAAAPVGELRWAPPQAYRSKSASRNATSFAPACMQSPRILDWYRDLAETFGASRDVFDDLVVSEDCLYLNIWTPAVGGAASLPVMVYLHGGSNNSGWAYEPNYHGHALAGRGAVVVSIAYRLGVFGFFAHPELDGSNFGLRDQLAALEWIQQYIASFGGDPDRVTVFGESAGAQDVLALMATRNASGLFHRAILQSTAGFGIGRKASPTLSEMRQHGVETAALFGISGAASLQHLRSLPAAELLQTYESHFVDFYHSPIIDGALLERPVWDVVDAGELAPIPLIIGSNADEWYAGTSADSDDADVRAAIGATQFLNSAETLQAVAGETDPREAIDRIDSAENMLCPSQLLAAKQSALRGNAWVYYFSRVREGSAGALVRAYHGAELPYVFGTHDDWMTTTATDRELSEQMMRYWLAFAANGTPNAEGLPEWPVFAFGNETVMEFADEATLVAPQEAVLCGIFRKALSELRPDQLPVKGQ